MRYKVREFRKKKGLSQSELSNISGVSRAIISGLETGKTTTVTTGTIEKIANALNVPISKILLP